MKVVAGAGGGASESGVGGRSGGINQDAFGGAPSFAQQLAGSQPSVFRFGEGASFDFDGSLGTIPTVNNIQFGTPAARGGTGLRNGGAGVFAGFTVGSGGAGSSGSLSSSVTTIAYTSQNGSGPIVGSQLSAWTSLVENMIRNLSNFDRKALARAVLNSALESVAPNGIFLATRDDYFWPQDPVWVRQGLLPLGPHDAIVPTTLVQPSAGIRFVGKVTTLRATRALQASALELLKNQLYTSALTFSAQNTVVGPPSSWPLNTTAALLQSVWPLYATTHAFVGSGSAPVETQMTQTVTATAANTFFGVSDSFLVPLFLKTLTIEAHGSGGSSVSSFPGGAGASIRMNGASLAGHRLRYFVGLFGYKPSDDIDQFQQSLNGGGRSGSVYTGGGMTAVYDLTASEWLLVAAGGGGGGLLGPGLSAEATTVGNGFTGRSASFNRGGSGGSSFFGGSTDSTSGGGGQGFFGGGAGSQGFGGGAGSSFTSRPAQIKTSTRTLGGTNARAPVPGTLTFTFEYT